MDNLVTYLPAEVIEREIIPRMESYFPNKLGLSWPPQKFVPFSIKEIDRPFQTLDEFEMFLKEVTKKGTLREAEKVLHQDLAIYKSSPESLETQSQTVPTQNLENLTPEAEKRAEELAKAAEKGRERKEEFINQARDSAQRKNLFRTETTEIQEKIKGDLKDKVIYIERADKTIPATLTGMEKDAVENIARATRLNPRATVDILSREIIATFPESIVDSISKEELITTSRIVAADFATRVTYNIPSAPPEIFLAIANSEDSLSSIINNPQAIDSIIRSSIPVAQVTDASTQVLRAYLSPLVGENVLNTIYGYSNQQYVVSSSPNDQSLYRVDLSKLQESASLLRQNPLFDLITKPVTDEVKSQAVDWGKNFLNSHLQNLPREGLLGPLTRFLSGNSIENGLSLLVGSPAEYSATSLIGKALLTFFPEYVPAITTIMGGLGISPSVIGLTSTLAPVVAGSIETGAVAVGATTGALASGAAGTTVTIAGASVGLSTGAGGGAAVASVAGGPVGIIVGIALALGPLLKNLWSKLKIKLQEHPEYLALVAVPLILPGILFGSIPLLLLGGTALVLGTRAIGTAGIITGTVLFFRAIGKAFIFTIGTPLIIFLVSFPIVVALILFIINSGAYIVPPKDNWGLPAQCAGDFAKKPVADGVLFSSDGKYAYPVAPGNSVGEDCSHWDGALATDIFPIGGPQAPVVAYTSGVIYMTVENDSLGGRYIILQGDDGRYYYYAHNCALFVSGGQRVAAGEVLATSDTSGSAAGTPEHLHFAISTSPNFYDGGTICPSADFARRFSSYNRCIPSRRCTGGK